MGQPIKVGDSFSDYNTVYSKLVNEKRVTFDEGCYSRDGRYHRFNGQNANGQLMAGNAEINEFYHGFGNFGGLKYSNQYKPQNTKSAEDGGNSTFTVIYDYCDDVDEKKRYYYKATDLNGNGYIDEGEITKYDNLKDLFNNKF